MNHSLRLPLSVRLAGSLVVVVGGGNVGLRKARTLSAAGAAVRIVDPLPKPDSAEASWEWIQAEFVADHLTGASLVVLAANQAVNSLAAIAARERGLWIADAVSPERGNVHFPAVGRRGRLTLSVDTDGAAPSLAIRLRDEWLSTLGDDFAAWLDLLLDVRREVRAVLDDTNDRQALTAEFAQDHWRQVFSRHGAEPVRQALAARLRELQSRPK